MPAKILIIIPCYNEEASLPSLLSELSRVANGRYDYLVVNDGSSDRSSDVAKKHGAIVLDLPINVGIGGAMQTGFLYARDNNYDIAIQVDGDGQHPPPEIQKLVDDHCLGSKANIIIGSRFLTEGDFKSTYLRRVGIRYFYRLNRILTGARIFDSTSGFRLFDSEAIKIAASYYPEEYPEPESLILFSKAGLTVSEIPVVMKARSGGKSSIRNFTSLYYMLKVSIAMFSTYQRYSKNSLWAASRS